MMVKKKHNNSRYLRHDQLEWNTQTIKNQQKVSVKKKTTSLIFI